MLKTRVITALALLAGFLVILFSNSILLVELSAAVIFAAASWESLRLFRNKQAVIVSIVWMAGFGFLIFGARSFNPTVLFGLCAAIWLIRLVPSLAIGLPPLDGIGNRLLSGIYGLAILGCFVAIVVLFKHSPLYLFSVMAIVWIADIGAYFSGKALGKHKLAPSISPGKTWEGAVGGWLAVLLFAALTTMLPFLNDTFAAAMLGKRGWLGLALAMTVMTAASVVGDLFESQLKRRAGMKDSSNLLPGHGGILDRIDALIPALPLAVLFDSLF